MPLISMYQRVLRKLKKNGLRGVLSIAIRSIALFFSGFLLKKVKPDTVNILYIIGCSEGESKRYRVFNLIEAISPCGIAAQFVYQQSLPYLSPNGYSAIIFFRCKMNSLTSGFIKKCQRFAIPTIYDVDDLVFDEAYVDKICKEDNLSTKQHLVYVNEARKYKAMLQSCDYATGSTAYLCDYIRELSGIQTYHIPNGLNNSQLNITSNLTMEVSTNVKIGFLSGSATHNMDFAQVEQALTSILSRYPHVSLIIVGYLDLPDSLRIFGNRISLVPFMDYITFLRFCGQLYAVIIPLEYDTAFCNAKSELKYFEQALVGVPVIASPTETYKACISDGVNGLLAKNTQQWEKALERLITNKEFRDSLVNNARLQIRERYYPDRIGETASTAYMQILSNSQKGGEHK